MTSSRDPQTDQEKHAAMLAALKKSPRARIVEAVPQAWMLDAKSVAAVKRALRR